MKSKKLIVIPLLGLLLTSCGNKPVTKVDFSFTKLDNPVELHTELQLKYINATEYKSTSGIATGSSEKSAPEAVHLSWEASADNGETAKSYIVKLTGADGNEYSYETEENKLDVYNLKLNTKYTYYVNALYSEASFDSEKQEFTTTSKGPRNLNVDQVMNMRDLGGHGIEQGLIYRSARFNETDGSSKLTDASKKVLNEDLEIKTEVDLRRKDENGSVTASPIGDKVNYVHLPMVFGGNNILTFKGKYNNEDYDNPTEIKNFFNLLADEASYPVVFHCSIGKDRTGCMAYLVEALCGMAEEDIYRDYLFSNFAKISGMCNVEDIDDRYGYTISTAEGETLAEKTYNYLSNSVGVSKENLDKVISILKAK